MPSTLEKVTTKAEQAEKRVKRERERRKGELLAQQMTVSGISAVSALAAGFLNGAAHKARPTPSLMPAATFAVGGMRLPYDGVAGVLLVGGSFFVKDQLGDVMAGAGLGPMNVALGRAGFSLALK